LKHNNAKERSVIPIKINGELGPMLSKRYPAAIENNKTPSYPANEYAPFNIPLVSLGKFFAKILSTEIISNIEPRIINTQTEYAAKLLGLFSMVKNTVAANLVRKAYGTIYLTSYLSQIFPKKGNISAERITEMIIIFM
jgi:hypothetical protein